MAVGFELVLIVEKKQFMCIFNKADNDFIPESE